MSVKGIFKALIGTVLIIVVSSLIIEMINLTISALELTQISRIACRQAAVLFSQETYKDRGGSGTISMANSLTENGSLYVSGEFYKELGSSPESIYKSLYTKTAFTDWLDSTPSNHSSKKMIEYWNNIRLIDLGLSQSSVKDLGSINITDEDDMKEYTDSVTAKSYVDVMMTPLNMGVPYLDKDTTEKIFKWNLAQMTSNCDQSLIRDDPSKSSLGNFVYYKGFRVFANDAKITGLEYKVYELNNPSDLAEFSSITHIDNAASLGFTYGGGYEDYIGSSEDERSNVCIVGINYDIPISYEGITPLRRLAEFVWGYDVDGYVAQGSGDATDGHVRGDKGHYWNTTPIRMESGGFEGNNEAKGVLPVPGKLIYYVVR